MLLFFFFFTPFYRMQFFVFRNMLQVSFILQSSVNVLCCGENGNRWPSSVKCSPVVVGFRLANIAVPFQSIGVGAVQKWIVCAI